MEEMKLGTREKVGENGLTYREVFIEGVQIWLPVDALEANEEAKAHPLGKWGDRRGRYLEETGKDWSYYLEDTMREHLQEIDRQASRMEEQLMESIMRKEEASIPDRGEHPLEWARYMNNLQSRVDEIIRATLIEV